MAFSSLSRFPLVSSRRSFPAYSFGCPRPSSGSAFVLVVLHIHNSESENTCSYNSLGKHCQIMFLRTFGSRRPPTVAPRNINLFEIINSDCDMNEGFMPKVRKNTFPLLEQQHSMTSGVFQLPTHRAYKYGHTANSFCTLSGQLLSLIHFLALVHCDLLSFQL